MQYLQIYFLREIVPMNNRILYVRYLKWKSIFQVDVRKCSAHERTIALPTAGY